MSSLLQYFILLPLLVFFISLFIPHKKESLLSGLVIFTLFIHLIGSVALVVFWLVNKHPILDIKHFTVYESGNVKIFVDFYFDKVTAAYVLVGSVLGFLVSVFSRYYMHRDEGFKRFFNILMLFYTGYNIIIISGNFETLFVGWEFIGISSFLLIAFYRDRYLPVKNGFKVVSLYRLTDVCLMVAMAISHHIWKENITFIKMNNFGMLSEYLQQHYWPAIFVSLMLLMVAAIKSAQFPFSSWLPRAMEGPTTSSAIFYGSLSAHIGVFVLLRTYIFWENHLIIKVMIIAMGLFTGLVATGISRVQSSVKAQISYSSIAQLGIILIEVALGWHVLALVHFAGNAFLRTYQLLVSPSVMSYLSHNQFYNFKPTTDKGIESPFKKISYSFYVLCLKEWNTDFMLKRFLWDPFKWTGKMIGKINSKIALLVLSIIYGFGIYCFYFEQTVPSGLFAVLPIVFAFLALLLVLKAFSERGKAKRAWLLVVAGKFFIALCITLNEHFEVKQILIYLSGVVIAGAAGFICLSKVNNIDNDIELNRYHGYVYEMPKLTVIFLLASLGVLGFPITPTFIGVDLLFTHIHIDQAMLLVFTALSYIFIELAVIRIYCRIFLGQHKKTFHPMAYKSS